jgi:hypothetical protein
MILCDHARTKGITERFSKNIKIHRRCQIWPGMTRCSLGETCRQMPPEVTLWSEVTLTKPEVTLWSGSPPVWSKSLAIPAKTDGAEEGKKMHKGAAVIFSTVYLRFHYMIDIAAGVAFAGITLLLGSAIRAWWVTGVLDRSGRSYISSPPRPLAPSA